MFEVSFEDSAALLRLRFAAKVSAEETKQGAEKIISIVGQLKRSFRMLTDLSELEEMELGCAQYIKQVMDACNEAGIVIVVRVIPDPSKDIGLNIMSLFHYDRGVKIVTCRTLEEATKALATY